MQCDVCDEAQSRAAVERLGGLDVLVYSHRHEHLPPRQRDDDERLHRVFDTNVLGAACVTAAALPYIAAAQGHAVYLGSESAFYEPTPWRGIGAYIASKRALDSMYAFVPAREPRGRLHQSGHRGHDHRVRLGGRPRRHGAYATDWATKGYLYQALLQPSDHADVVVSILGLPTRVQVDRVRPGHAPS
jgi:hypothetical protein